MYNTQPEFALNNASLQLTGNCGFNINNNRVVINIDSITSQRAADDISGTVAIELWALKQPYQGGSFSGVALASTSIGEVLGQHFIADCRYDLLFNEPPAGTWYLTLMLREWTGNGYQTRDFVNFATPYTASWVPTVVQGTPANVIKASFNETEKSNKAEAKAEAPQPAAQPATKAAPAKEVTGKATAKTAKPVAEKAVAEKKPVAEKAAAKPAPAKAAAAITVNLNKASADEIAAINGVSGKLAARLVESRPFKSMDEVIKVKGMGAKLMQKIAKSISL